VILVDTSVWIDHLRAGNQVLARLLWTHDRRLKTAADRLRLSIAPPP
jgi:predicted nucleic acid-binding protein